MESYFRINRDTKELCIRATSVLNRAIKKKKVKEKKKRGEEVEFHVWTSINFSFESFVKDELSTKTSVSGL